MKDLLVIIANQIHIIKRYGLSFWWNNNKQNLHNRANQLRGNWPI